ncbi:3-oxoadipate enol-lactonase [Janthinobacterium psychrotolerans]|uniref:3-oxoadipate enol-lactonase n=1 Tax=Janthinobacterium psychrotolerans TaxID=1747903 RepID=A0A1A7C2Q1_9BURK|nr:3-oxoadipate enol-lactonase [Janthinobacterium psychrotolerans]OBV38593.1 3-oxoadipate enol-lactonase [Janthinobacterium psychrotolerans]
MPYAPLPDGQLHYSLQGDAGKPVLILSNSLGTSLDMWAPQMARFTEAFQVLRYDTRGHGKSSVTPGPYSIEQLAGDVIALMDHLNIAQAHFCGLSMGGLTGMALATGHPARVSRLVLCNTAAHIGTPEAWTARIAAVEQGGMPPLAPAVVARWLTPDYAAQHPATRAALEAMLCATPAAGYAAACAAVRDADLRAQVARITAPTLVIAAAHDLPTPAADGQFLRRQIAGARYVELSAAHLSNHEQAAGFAGAVVDFLTT